MKNKLKILLICALVLNIPFSAMANVGEITDLDSNSKYFKSISSFITEGVVSGYDDNTFKPENNVNRAEALKIILEAFNLSNEAQAEISFPDVPEGEWFTNYVATGVQLGVVKGYNDGQFRPGNNVNFAEALKMALFAKGVDTNSVDFVDFHPSVRESDWFGNMFSYGFENNLIDLEDDGSLNPGKILTRAELVDIAYRVKSKPTNAPLDLAFNWSETSDESLISTQYPVEWNHLRFGEDGLVITSSDEVGIELFVDESVFNLILNVEEIDPLLEANEYLLNVKNELGEGWSHFEEGKRSGKYMISENESKIAFHYWVENGKVIIGEANTGESLKSIELNKIAQKIFSGADLRDGAIYSNDQEMLSTLRDFILVSNKGRETIDGFDEAEIIETDNIGVGTGPVDYYYIPSIDHTVKYERAEDIILDILEGRTVNF